MCTIVWHCIALYSIKLHQTADIWLSWCKAWQERCKGGHPQVRPQYQTIKLSNYHSTKVPQHNTVPRCHRTTERHSAALSQYHSEMQRRPLAQVRPFRGSKVSFNPVLNCNRWKISFQIELREWKSSCTLQYWCKRMQGYRNTARNSLEQQWLIIWMYVNVCVTVCQCLREQKTCCTDKQMQGNRNVAWNWQCRGSSECGSRAKSIHWDYNGLSQCVSMADKINSLQCRPHWSTNMCQGPWKVTSNWYCNKFKDKKTIKSLGYPNN